MTFLLALYYLLAYASLLHAPNRCTNKRHDVLERRTLNVIESAPQIALKEAHVNPISFENHVHELKVQFYKKFYFIESLRINVLLYMWYIKRMVANVVDIGKIKLGHVVVNVSHRVYINQVNERENIPNKFNAR